MHGIDELSSMTMPNATKRRKTDKEGNFMALPALLSMEGERERERGGESAAHLLPEDAGLMCLARHQINHFRASEGKSEEGTRRIGYLLLFFAPEAVAAVLQWELGSGAAICRRLRSSLGLMEME